MTNKVLARFASKVFITLEESAKFFPQGNTLLTGNPLRRQIVEMAETIRHEHRTPVTDDSRRFRIFVFGGSQGAHAINMALISALPYLSSISDRLEISHQTGKNDCAEVQSAYAKSGITSAVQPFISDMAAEYHKADLIICRAGATTIAEVTACGKACLFIPFPHAVDDHQRRNAEALLKKEAGLMLLEHELSGEQLAKSIQDLLKDPEILLKVGEAAYSLARLDAARIIVDEMMKTQKEGSYVR
jgi:UDP-N-acetylglucosamine--N-acetylmuramyl-(pentapeptide) pyrophosphoryl-undecaprenol N-acetylglucosamine transferase